MMYKKGDRILYSRLMFGAVYQDQTSDDVVHAVFDRERGVIQSVRSDLVELVSDAHHEAILAALINTPVREEGARLAEEFVKIAYELEAGAETETNAFRLRATMKNAALRLRSLAKEL